MTAAIIVTRAAEKLRQSEHLPDYSADATDDDVFN